MLLPLLWSSARGMEAASTGKCAQSHLLRLQDGCNISPVDVAQELSPLCNSVDLWWLTWQGTLMISVASD